MVFYQLVNMKIMFFCVCIVLLFGFTYCSNGTLKVDESQPVIDAEKKYMSENVIPQVSAGKNSWANGEGVKPNITDKAKKYFTNVVKEGEAKRRRKRSVAESPRIREDIHLMDEDERDRTLEAFVLLHNTFISNDSDESIYDTFAAYHTATSAPGAHKSCCFLPWHKLYLFFFEEALRRVYENATIPLMDWTPEFYLGVDFDNKWSDSAIFSVHVLGNTDSGDSKGVVSTGPFANWTIYPECAASLNSEFLTRGIAPGNSHFGLLSPFKIKQVVEVPNAYYGDISTPFDGGRLENWHGGAHEVTGGCLAHLDCAPTDPLFYMHHAFVDCMWEKFRDVSQTSNREYDYPPVHAITQRFGSRAGLVYANSSMLPFDGLRNIDGLSSYWTSIVQMSDTSAYISCNLGSSDCGPLSWCYYSLAANHQHCVAKIQENKRCATDTDPETGDTRYYAESCYCRHGDSICVYGDCACA